LVLDAQRTGKVLHLSHKVLWLQHFEILGSEKIAIAASFRMGATVSSRYPEGHGDQESWLATFRQRTG
jgi:hypothetical protein